MKSYEENIYGDMNEFFLHPEKLDTVDFMRYAPKEEELYEPERHTEDLAAYTIAWLKRYATTPEEKFIAQFARRILGVTNWFDAMHNGFNKKTKKKKTNGAPRHDIFQAVCASALKVWMECTDERWLAFLMKRRLPQYVFRALKEQYLEGSGFDPQEILLRVPERETKKWLRRFEAMDILERELSGTDLAVVKDVLAGKGQEEIAQKLGVQQSSVSKRLAAICDRLRGKYPDAAHDDPDDREVFPELPEEPEQDSDPFDE